jgi:hypothetical protein
MLPRVSCNSPYLGCDPEFFFKVDGEVIGAEKIIPKEGIKHIHQANLGTAVPDTQSKFIIDGVQAELNPRPFTCRANLANEIAACFKTLKAELAKQKGKVQVDFSRTIEISKENLDQLSEDSKKFGCAPSKSVYRNAGVKIDTINPTEYRTRSAGGHIHFGHGTLPALQIALKYEFKKTVAMLDIILGNTCVLIDRAESNVERRKLYGRAGEFRLPAHGLEYRTLSNFWLTSYPLMSLVFGLGRLAVQLVGDNVNSDKFFKEFTSKVKPKDIRNAINNNDFDLAMANFKAIESILVEVAPPYDYVPIHSENIKEFYHFVSTVKEQGLEYWWKDDPMTHWTTLPEAHLGGFADFLKGGVRRDMNKKLMTEPKTV